MTYQEQFQIADWQRKREERLSREKNFVVLHILHKIYNFANVVKATPATSPIAVTTACTLISISISISINGQKVVGQKVLRF